MDQEERTLRPGDVVADKYRVERELGRGGMGAVFLAVHQRLDERVAIKVLHPSFARDRGIAKRFEREARAAARIKSEHVARMIDVGELADGAPYLVMEHLVGRDLGDEVEARPEVAPVAEVVDWIVQACVALAEAHAQGIVHRDVKPPNLFLTHRADGSPLVKVLDFGIAKAVSSDGPASANVLTGTATMLGSPAYMSPEQVRSSRDVDERTDVWSLGVALYELLSRTHPFRGGSPSAVLAAVVMDPPAPLTEARPGLPLDLMLVIERCLQKSAADRYPDVGALARALAPFGHASTRTVADRVVAILAARTTLTYDPERAPLAAYAPLPSPGSERGRETPLLPPPAFAAQWPARSPAAAITAPSAPVAPAVPDAAPAAPRAPLPSVRNDAGNTAATATGTSTIVRRSRRSLLLLGVLALVAGAAVGGVLMITREPPAPAPSPSPPSPSPSPSSLPAVSASSTPSVASEAPAVAASDAPTASVGAARAAPVARPTGSAPRGASQPKPKPRPNDVDERL